MGIELKLFKRILFAIYIQELTGQHSVVNVAKDLEYNGLRFPSYLYLDTICMRIVSSVWAVVFNIAVSNDFMQTLT